jgi:hypothetical protein
MKREVRVLFEKAIDSLVLSIEHFNRPWDRGREEAVLILLDRSFELLLKSAIVHRGGKIRERRAKETIGHDKCVRKCLTDDQVKCLNEDQALTIQIINSLRDAAQHYLLEISEQQLYLYAQAGVTLFDSILRVVFASTLTDHLPERVLPISTSPPQDLHVLMEAEFKELKQLIAPRSRKRLQARAKLRSLAIIESSLQGERSQPSKGELDRLLKQVAANKSWQDVFPGVATLNLDTSGSGLSVSLRITKSKGEPVTLVPEGTPGATLIAVRRVNELGFYSLGLMQLAQHLELSPPRTLAVVKELGLQSNDEYFKEIQIGKTRYKRYSHAALEILRQRLPDLDIEEIWRKNKPPSGRRRR